MSDKTKDNITDFSDQCKILGESIEGCYSSAIRYV